MKINVTGNKVVSLSMQDSKSRKESFKIGFDVEFLNDAFFVVFSIKLISVDHKKIDLVYRTDFKTDIPIDEDFKKKPYPFVNGPAISYPFLRSFLATLTLNAGMMPILLPSINFLAIWQDKQSKLSQEKV